MLLSQVDPSVANAGVVLLGLTAIVMLAHAAFGLAVTIQKLFSKKVDPSNEFITRAELEKTVHEIEKKIDSLNNDMTKRIERMSDELNKKADKANEYASRIAHEQANIMNLLALKVERLLTLREADTGMKRVEVEGT